MMLRGEERNKLIDVFWMSGLGLILFPYALIYLSPSPILLGLPGIIQIHFTKNMRKNCSLLPYLGLPLRFPQSSSLVLLFKSTFIRPKTLEISDDPTVLICKIKGIVKFTTALMVHL